MPEKPHNFWQELKRRKVIRVITVYAASAFVILELVDIVAPSLGLPAWTLNFVIVLLCVGFILSITLSWVYDITPEGVKKTKSIDEVMKFEKKPTSNTWKVISYISIFIIIILVVVNIISGKKRIEDISELEKSIAVLPFDNMSLGEEFAHMGDAITDEIILELQKIKEFDRVLSRSSTMQYKNDRPTIPEMAEKLGVNYLIEGSIQRHDEEVSIRVQVIRAKNEDHVWADKYNRKWADIFSIQDEIALNVANELKAVLAPEEVRQIEKQPTDNLEAYDLYLMGRYFWYQRREEDLLKSINYFNRAIELDSNYALAYAGLADAYFILPWYSDYPSNIAYTDAKKYAEIALSINKDIGEAHSTLGELALWNDHNWELAEEEFKVAISINPQYDVAHQYYFELLRILGRTEEAEEQINLALKYNPNFFIYLNQRGKLYFEGGRYNEAIQEFTKVMEQRYYYNSALYTLMCYLYLEKDKEAIDHIKDLIDNYYNSSNSNALLNEIYQTSGIEGIISWFTDWLIKNRPQSYYEISSFYGFLGNNTLALEYLEKYMESNAEGKLFFINDPSFNNLKSEPRYLAIVRSMGL